MEAAVLCRSEQNDTPEVQRLVFRSADAVLDMEDRLEIARPQIIAALAKHALAPEKKDRLLLVAEIDVFEHAVLRVSDPALLHRGAGEPLAIRQPFAAPRA